MTTEQFFRKLAAALELPQGQSLNTDTKLSGIWDSMGQISVLTMLDTEFQVSLQMDELSRINTAGDIINVLNLRNIKLD
jgi:acyl carrier protein